MDLQKNNVDVSQDHITDKEKREQEVKQHLPKEKATLSPAGAYFKLWSFASPIDILLRCIAAFAAAGSGTAEPLMAFIFGKLVNIFNGDPPVSPEQFRAEINKNALYFVYLFIGKFAVSGAVSSKQSDGANSIACVSCCNTFQFHLGTNDRSHSDSIPS